MAPDDKPAPRLRLIATGGQPRPRELWRCPKCAANGREGHVLMRVVLEAEIVGREIVPGETGFACMACFVRGIVTLV